MSLKDYCRNSIRAFYDAGVYKEAIEQGRGFGGRHILFVGTVIGLVLTLAFCVSINLFARTELPFIAQQVPEIRLKDHQLIVRGPQPRMIKSSDGRFRVYIDTQSGDVNLFKQDAEILVGKNIVLLKKGEDDYKEISLSKFDDFVLNKQSMLKFFESGIYAVSIILWPLSALGQAFSLLVQTFVLALLTYIVTAPMKEEYYFETRMRLCALAITPSFVISRVTGIINDASIKAPIDSTWFGLLLGLLYFYVMIMLIRRLNEPAKA